MTSTVTARSLGKPYLFPSLQAAADGLRRKMLAARPLLRRALAQIERSVFSLGVDGGKDVLLHQASEGDTLPSVARAAAVFARRHDIALSPHQSLADIGARSIVVDPRHPRAGDVVYLHVDRVGGLLGNAREMVRGLTERIVETELGFGHHVLDHFCSFSLFDCLVMAVEELGVVREDLNGLDWSTLESSIKNVRRGVFRGDPWLANRVLAAERLLSGGNRDFSPRVLRTLNDTRLALFAGINLPNLRRWNLARYRSSCLKTVAGLIGHAFPFVHDPLFDPRERLFRHCRKIVFEHHPKRAFLSRTFRRLTWSVSARDLARARRLVKASTSFELERWGVAHHSTDRLEPRLTVLDLCYAAFSLFDLIHIPWQAVTGLKTKERRRLEEIMQVIVNHHPQGELLFGVFFKLMHGLPIELPKRLKVLELMRDLSLASLVRWGARLPGKAAESHLQVSDMITEALPAFCWGTDALVGEQIRFYCYKQNPALATQIETAQEILASTERVEDNLGYLANLQQYLRRLVAVDKLRAAGAVGFESTPYARNLEAAAVLAFPQLGHSVLRRIDERRAEFMGSFDRKCPRMALRLRRKGIELSPEELESHFVAFDLDRQATRTEVAQEMMQLREKECGLLNPGVVAVGSVWVRRFSIYLFDDLFGKDCERYLKSPEFIAFVSRASAARRGTGHLSHLPCFAPSEHVGTRTAALDHPSPTRHSVCTRGGRTWPP
jgi:hypothetical protein